jgi:UvrD-like helicase family protein
MTYPPTDEQQAAIDLFAGGGSLRIDAYAGTGKTTTLRYLAQSTGRRGHYLAFNKSIATHAQQLFPDSVRCTTCHSVAYGAIRSRYGDDKNKMTGNANAILIPDVLALPEYTQFSERFGLSKRAYGAVLKGAIRRFLCSEDDIPVPKHFPRIGRLAVLDRDQFAGVTSTAVTHLRRLWEEMQAFDSRMPLGHDGYVKLWSLTSPRIHADYIMLDEAQDSNPVLLKVLRQQPCQMVYVGDPYQQIYEWRGAVNAMEKVLTDHRTRLTQSFRFGDTIANEATKVIARLGASAAIRGTPTMTSHVCPVHPNTILCRTNAGVMSNLVTHQNNGARTYVVGGTKELEILLDNVKRLKRGIPSELPEFYGFANWNEVVQHVEEEHDEGLRLLVKLVAQYGEDRLLQALRSCVDSESAAQIIVSTAHKAKGCEWDVVQLDRDFDSAFSKQDRAEQQGSKWDLEAEGRLFYVAMTRAKSAVELPPGAMTFFGITNSRSEHFGMPYVSESRPAAMRASARASASLTIGNAPPLTSSQKRWIQTTRPPSLKTVRPDTPAENGIVNKILRALFGK